MTIQRSRVRLPALPLLCDNCLQFVDTYTSAPVTKQCNVIPAKEHRAVTAANITADLLESLLQTIIKLMTLSLVG